jgi:hypothetical protein
MTLEDIRVIFAHGFGVKKARELQKQKKMANLSESRV